MNLDIRGVKRYSEQLIEIVRYVQNSEKYYDLFNDFSITKHGRRNTYKNSNYIYRNSIFNFLQVLPSNQYAIRNSAVINYKIDYRHTGDRIRNIDVLDEENYQYNEHECFTLEQLQDDGFLFQQSLVLDEGLLFGVCCVSWLNQMQLNDIYLTCEFDIDEMNRVHGEIMNAK